MTQYKTIAESNNFIVLDQYNKFVEEPNAGYQTEGSLEREFIRDLQAQGYEYLQGLNHHDELIKNLRVQLQRLNNMVFSDAEWRRFLEEYLDKPSDSLIEKTRKIHDDYIYDFVFDDGHIQNIYLLDKRNLANNAVQVINQFEQTGSYDNRYDVTILVNGLPLVHIELKNVAWPFVKPLIKFTATAKKVSIKKIRSLNIFRFLSFLMARTPAILPIPPNAIRIAMTSQ